MVFAYAFQEYDGCPVLILLNKGKVNLKLLHLRSNPVSDISALAGMVKLVQLDITTNNITDLTPLVANSGLAGVDTTYVRQNPLSQQSLTVDIPALRARGMTVRRLRAVQFFIPTLISVCLRESPGVCRSILMPMLGRIS